MLDRPIQFLKGVGPARAESFARLGVRTARDLLYWVPRRYDDASRVDPIRTVEVGMDVTVVGRVLSKGIVPTRKGLRIFQAVLQDDTGMITASWPGQPWLDRKLEKGDLVLVSGPVRFFHGRQIQPREMTVLARAGKGDDADVTGTIFVSYPASEEVPQWVLRTVIARNLDALLEQAREHEECWSRTELGELGLLGLADALEALHRPTSLDRVEEGRRRLAFDELWFLQLLQARARHEAVLSAPGVVFERSNRLIRPLLESLPFSLTDAQARVLKDIVGDLGSGRRMSRLLQGDVGSGKTLVALFAMVLAVESGYQAALMAPTEILAEQHTRRMGELLEPLGLEVELLTGRLNTAERKRVLGRLASGEAPLVVGTHALIQEGVTFARPGLVVVDEQHRFGAHQRLRLTAKGAAPDMLVMTATPIPRTLVLTAFGDMDVSK
ncbi:MAG: DEAD/DEAH box helicase, partial [Gemmatimonadetes bacterium]|nr:DEAD/DEAH box helicase [Gemmatimonadota bacterium]